ncbi:MAG TPA: LysM peptidoglycan-binding domain-containing protein [Chloroflexi bacterium]|nr:LysM peptidoglycan-binding domain-containing protein [Chloroflexota bacterium]
MSKRKILIFSLIVILSGLTACRSEVVTPAPTRGIHPTSTATFAPIPTPRVTATAPFAPPAATPTPTVTPTPIIHVVQSGDVLGAIAYQYGVSVQAIQAANGIENPQFLKIGQELIIPSGDDEVEIAPGLLLPTPTPAPLDPQGVGFYRTPVGSLWCLGEVENPNEAALTHVQVRVALYDAGGELLVAANAFVAADLIPPGERAPFGVLFTNPPADWVNSQVLVIRGETAGELTRSYIPLTVVEVDGQLSDPRFRIQGQVQNAGAERAANRALVVATTYDTQGTVTGFRQKSLELEENLAPGGTASFDLWLDFHGDPPADFHVLALARVTAE